MRKTVILLLLLALLVPLSASAITAAGAADQPVRDISAGSVASPPTLVEPAFDINSLFQVRSSSPVWFVRGACADSCRPCSGYCPPGEGPCAAAC
jgi:hypothetical protein